MILIGYLRGFGNESWSGWLALVGRWRRIHTSRSRRSIELWKHRFRCMLVSMAWINRLKYCRVADHVKHGIKRMGLDGDGSKT